MFQPLSYSLLRIESLKGLLLCSNYGLQVARWSAMVSWNTCSHIYFVKLHVMCSPAQFTQCINLHWAYYIFIIYKYPRCSPAWWFSQGLLVGPSHYNSACATAGLANLRLGNGVRFESGEFFQNFFLMTTYIKLEEKEGFSHVFLPPRHNFCEGVLAFDYRLMSFLPSKAHESCQKITSVHKQRLGNSVCLTAKAKTSQIWQQQNGMVAAKNSLWSGASIGISTKYNVCRKTNE